MGTAMVRGSRNTNGDSNPAVYLDEKYQGSQRAGGSCASDLKRSLRMIVSKCAPKCFYVHEDGDDDEREPLNLGDAWDSSPPLTPVTPGTTSFSSVTTMSPAARSDLEERLMVQRQRIFEAEVQDVELSKEAVSSRLNWSGFANTNSFSMPPTTGSTVRQRCTDT